ncbi:molybdenum cofactor biosynthesis protein B, putative (plasmid) [Acaryochloris marina MBIC11017]|uniref:Molybdenum cofactor biosynthesis protein B n=1 Tax=Acaryochloris marina (strain MBIC 11017) TaxID=329726 RepID=A8ZQ82_ACAM1|nr:molybdenum cofactor biosynthesis protein B, putative [Acaryochloris marina MBIC11017]
MIFHLKGLRSSHGHPLAEKVIVLDDIYKIRAVVSRWIADESVQPIITTGGTGVTGRDGTPEAIQPVLDKEIQGFGELFRMISYEDIKTSTIQSRALSGVANGTYLFCLLGSSGACRTGWDDLIQDQLDVRHSPCNLAELMPRLREYAVGSFYINLTGSLGTLGFCSSTELTSIRTLVLNDCQRFADSDFH